MKREANYNLQAFHGKRDNYNDSRCHFQYKYLLNLIRSTRCLGNSQFMYRMATWLYDRYSENSFVIRDVSIFRVFFPTPTTFLSLRLHIKAFPEFSIILNYANLITNRVN